VIGPDGKRVNGSERTHFLEGSDEVEAPRRITEAEVTARARRSGRTADVPEGLGTSTAYHSLQRVRPIRRRAASAAALAGGTAQRSHAADWEQGRASPTARTCLPARILREHGPSSGRWAAKG